MTDDGQLTLSFLACLEAIRLFKHETNELFSRDDHTLASFRQRLTNLIELLLHTIDHTTPDNARQLSSHHQCLVLLFIFIDNFMLLPQRQSTSLATYLNHLIARLNSVYFSGQETVDFCTQASLQSLHEFIRECQASMPVNELGEEVSERLAEALNVSYVNVVEILVFKTGDGKKTAEPGEVELILKTITDNRAEDSFNIRLIHRSLLTRIVYRNCPELVCSLISALARIGHFICLSF